MAVLAADEPRAYEATGAGPTFNDLAAQVDIHFVGSAMSIDANGDVGPLLATEAFVGFCEENIDNSAGAAGSVNVKVRQKGHARLTVVGVDDHNDVNAQVFATDDNTFTLTTSGGAVIGKVIRWIASTTCIVAFEGAQVRSV